MKNRIIFMGPYPTEKNRREGMVQRIEAIDHILSDTPVDKIYLSISFKTIHNTKRIIGKNIVEYNLSIWTAYLKIIHLLNSADIIYVHSLYGLSVCGLLFLHLVKPPIIWDVHGIIPEELSFADANGFKVAVFSLLERRLSQRANRIITVSNKMKEHLENKYPNITAQFLVYPILPITTNNITECSELSSSETAPLCIYSGNTQKYQNIEMMLHLIQQSKVNVKYLILTGQPDEMKRLLAKSGICKPIEVESVEPKELHKYYSKATFGFILRDDTPLNRVACPTKLVEYLAYGIIPITLSEEIGDFNSMGYEHISMESFVNFSELSGFNNKSSINTEIFRKLNNTCSSKELIKFIFE